SRPARRRWATARSQHRVRLGTALIQELHQGTLILATRHADVNEGIKRGACDFGAAPLFSRSPTASADCIGLARAALLTRADGTVFFAPSGHCDARQIVGRRLP